MLAMSRVPSLVALGAACGRLSRIAAQRYQRLWWALAAPVEGDLLLPQTTVPPDEAAPRLDPLQLDQWLWGEGHLCPGSDKECLDLVRPLSLRPASRLLLLTARLGHDAMTIAKGFGCQVAALERDPQLLRLAVPVVRSLPRVTLAALDPTAPKLDGSKPDHAFGRFVLHDVADRRDLLAWCRATIRPGGHIVLVEYVAGSRPSPDMTVWARRMKLSKPLWTIATWRHVAAQLGLDLRIEEDVSARHKSAILKSWARLLSGRELAGMPKRQMLPVLDAAERWMREVALIDSGALHVIRFYMITPN